MTITWYGLATIALFLYFFVTLARESQEGNKSVFETILCATWAILFAFLAIGMMLNSLGVEIL